MAVSAKAVKHDFRVRNQRFDSGGRAPSDSQQKETDSEGNVIQDIFNFLGSAVGSGVFGSIGKTDKGQEITDKVKKVVEDKQDIINLVAGGTAAAIDSANDADEDSTTPQSGSSAKPIVYSNWSPAAQKFGMDQSTAYAEHMANTAHQREVADLRAAGLNPVLGVGSGASGVSGHVATSGSSAQKSLNGDFIVDAIGATAAVVTAILTKNPAYGYMAGNAVNAVGDLVTSRKK